MIQHLRLIGLFTVILAACGSAHAQRAFVGGEILPLTSRADSVVLEDLNGDGLGDLVAAHAHRSEASILLALPGGAFAEPAVQKVGPSPVLILAGGDFDADQRKDLFVVNSGAATISVLLNGGDGAWSEPLVTKVGPNPRAAGLADFNSDGFLDAVTSDLVTIDLGQLTMLLGDGKGGFTQGTPVPVGDNPHSVAVEDFDADGRLDLAVAHTHTISLFRSRGDGVFDPAVKVELSQINPRVLVSGELTGDGRPDLAIYLDGGNLLVLVNEQAGAFSSHVFPAEGGLRSSALILSAADFDLDGIGDVVTTVGRGKGETGLRVRRGTPDAVFPILADHFPAVSVGAGAFSDIDADGAVDAVLARSDSAEICVYHGLAGARLALPASASTPVEPRDIVALDAQGDGALELAAIGSSSVQLLGLDRDGVLTARDPLELPGRAIQAGAEADFDGDARMDIALADLATGAVVLVLDPSAAGPRMLERAAGLLPHRLAPGDFDGDGELDLCVLDQVESALSVLLRPLADPPSERLSVPVGADLRALEASDLDGDGHLDLAVASRESVSILGGDGRGAFALRRSLEDAKSMVAIRALPGSGVIPSIAMAGARRLLLVKDPAGKTEPERLDAALAADARALDVAPIGAGAGSGVQVAVAGRDRVLATQIEAGAAVPLTFDPFPLGSLLRNVVLADLDADGALECATGDFGASVVAVLKGQRARGPRFRRGDADSDGRAAITDAVVILERLFAGRAPLACPDAGDADDSGALSLTDAVVLLSHLFQGGPPPAPPGPAACGEDPTADALDRCEAGC